MRTLKSSEPTRSPRSLHEELRIRCACDRGDRGHQFATVDFCIKLSDDISFSFWNLSVNQIVSEVLAIETWM